MSETSHTRLGVPADLPWQVDTWRLTAFLAPGEQPREPNWWKDLTGEEPETRLSNPRQSLFQEQGPWCGGTLTLAVQPGVVIWLYSVAPPGGEPTPTPSFLGPIPSSLERFRDLAHRWLAEAPHVNRLAIGGVFVQPTKDRESAYEILSRYLPAV